MNVAGGHPTREPSASVSQPRTRPKLASIAVPRVQSAAPSPVPGESSSPAGEALLSPVSAQSASLFSTEPSVAPVPRERSIMSIIEDSEEPSAPQTPSLSPRASLSHPTHPTPDHNLAQRFCFYISMLF